jgi:ergothioneine biosynthesis protein EgtB
MSSLARIELASAPTSGRPAALASRYRGVRQRTEWLCEPLEPEDMTVSSMPDVSPTKWHLAHTSWFFETFVLSDRHPEYASPHPGYAYLFNSYYVQAGERHCRAQRGLVTRPTASEVLDYRKHVDDHMHAVLDGVDDDPVVTLGLHHEQQHQELILTDIKHVFWTNPLRPAYSPHWVTHHGSVHASDLTWHQVPGGIHQIGHAGDGFAFDNESPSHRVLIEDFWIASHLVTNREFLAFVEDGGYRRADLWLAAGFALVREQEREAPLYWERGEDGWREFTLAGMGPLDLDEPVCHVSYYEADAFARWAGCRLPTEAEWEVAARLHPDLPGLFGARWQWTGSAYVAYPGYAPTGGALGEYNGKWMSDQWVLRGSSFATPPGHARPTYRNFFPSDTRWQFSGIRLAR